jgi:hypothetical protein
VCYKYGMVSNQGALVLDQWANFESSVHGNIVPIIRTLAFCWLARPESEKRPSSSWKQ